jgi:hypothetical protein
MDELMTQFRAIPIDWILSHEKYHHFLVWVAAKATFSGWGRCDSLQVTFTEREAASEFGVSQSTVSRWTAKAKLDGFLLPTNQSIREQGKGEVYNLGGLMLNTVKTPDQARIKDGSRTGYTDVCEQMAYTPQRIVDGQSADKERIVNRSTPDTPDTPTSKESSPSRARLSRERKMSMLDGYPEGALTVVRTLLPIWPEESPDGRKIIFDPHAASARVTEILAANPSIQPQLLIDAGNRYLRAMRETGSEKFISALHFFFGPGKGKTMPKWEEQVRAMKHDQSLEQNEPAPMGQGE